MTPKVSGVVLAGGRSTRLGFDKSLVPFGDTPLIARVVETIRPVVQECIVVTNDAAKLAGVLNDVRFVRDAIARRGALVGNYSGLLAAQYDHVLVVACDMPFLNVRLLRHLLALADQCAVVIPRRSKGTEPLHAVYARSCIAPIERSLHKGEVTIVGFFPEVKVCYVEEPVLSQLDPDGLSFVNINTPEDWEFAQALAWQRG